MGDNESFLESGILDSTGVLQLVDFLEQAYGVKVEDEELIPDNLDSIEKISAYLERKLHGACAGATPAVQTADAGGRL
ncbi:MAG TPA: acyl carrier protein [Bryobacteraceae bacterium]|nr:acyl carrier protein [Bryobacteraceae bacterium]